MHDRTETLELFRRWQAGDTKAIDQLAKIVLPWMQSAAHNAMGSQPRTVEDSEDLVQNVWLKLLSCIRFVPETVEQFRALVSRMARNAVIDARRVRESRPPERHLESVFDSGSAWLGSRRDKALAGLQSTQAAGDVRDNDLIFIALQFLDDRDRRLIEGHEILGRHWEVLADELGFVSMEAARAHAARLKPRLARHVSQLKRGIVPEPPAE